jgi:hypothetical protein
MTRPKTGEILKHLETGGLFEVKKKTKEFVIRNARDGSSQIMTGKGSLDFHFARTSRSPLLAQGPGAPNLLKNWRSKTIPRKP